ncbi:MAG: ABC transporter permease [Azoarcus sp.]|jgi:sulfonate transport system permease protein|nr:ABC transporter permease [Azoarcus sp.]
MPEMPACFSRIPVPALRKPSTSKRHFRLTGGGLRLPRLPSATLPWLLPLALFVLWQASSLLTLLPAVVLPSPAEVVKAFIELTASGELARHVGASITRVGQGFLVGAVAGIGLGLLMGMSRPMEELIHPTFRAFCQVPTMAWLPLLMMMFGIGEALKLIIIVKSTLVPMCINTFSGIRAIPEAYFEVARVCRLTRLALLTRLILPATIPPVFSGMRQGLAHAWVSLIGVELLASTVGIGYLMNWGRLVFQLDLVFVGIVVIGVIGLAMDSGMRVLERRLGVWRQAAVIDIA